MPVVIRPLLDCLLGLLPDIKRDVLGADNEFAQLFFATGITVTSRFSNSLIPVSRIKKSPMDLRLRNRDR